MNESRNDEDLFPRARTPLRFCDRCGHRLANGNGSNICRRHARPWDEGFAALKDPCAADGCARAVAFGAERQRLCLMHLMKSADAIGKTPNKLPK